MKKDTDVFMDLHNNHRPFAEAYDWVSEKVQKVWDKLSFWQIREKKIQDWERKISPQIESVNL